MYGEEGEEENIVVGRDDGGGANGDGKGKEFSSCSCVMSMTTVFQMSQALPNQLVSKGGGGGMLSCEV